MDEIPGIRQIFNENHEILYRKSDNRESGIMKARVLLSLFVQPEPSVLFLITHNGVSHTHPLDMSKKTKKRGPPNFCVKKIKTKADGLQTDGQTDGQTDRHN